MDNFNPFLSLKNRNIVIVEDDVSNFRYFETVLKKTQASIHWIKNGRDAINYCTNSSNNIDLVIMDMIMPKISGYDMINEFQKINSLARIVISSGYSEERDIQKLFENHEHILGFYKKPFDLVKFANDIASMLEQEA